MSKFLDLELRLSLEKTEEQIFLAFEVGVDGALGAADFSGDRFDLSTLEAVSDEDLLGDIK